MHEYLRLLLSVVPSHGRCRISVIMSEVMSEGPPYDMNLRRSHFMYSRCLMTASNS